MIINKLVYAPKINRSPIVNRNYEAIEKSMFNRKMFKKFNTCLSIDIKHTGVSDSEMSTSENTNARANGR